MVVVGRATLPDCQQRSLEAVSSLKSGKGSLRKYQIGDEDRYWLGGSSMIDNYAEFEEIEACEAGSQDWEEVKL